MIALAIGALLSFQDPAMDALGNGSLQPPTGPVYRTLEAYDLTEVAVIDTAFLTLALTFGALPNPFGLENGFSLPITELYLSDSSPEALPGATELLPGSGMALPPGETWHYALRLTGDGARLFRGTADGFEEIAEAGAVHLSIDGNTLTVSTAIERPEGFKLYGMVGSYSPFTESGWQPLSVTPSPWAFSSGAQQVPVIDVLAQDGAEQTEAMGSRTLPAVEVTPPAAEAPLNPWLLVPIGGLLVVLAGLAARLRAQDAPGPAPTDERPTDESSDPSVAPPSDTLSPDAATFDSPIFDTAALAAPLLFESEEAPVPTETFAPLELYDEDWRDPEETLWDEARESERLSPPETEREIERDPSVKPP